MLLFLSFWRNNSINRFQPTKPVAGITSTSQANLPLPPSAPLRLCASSPDPEPQCLQVCPNRLFEQPRARGQSMEPTHHYGQVKKAAAPSAGGSPDPDGSQVGKAATFSDGPKPANRAAIPIAPRNPCPLTAAQHRAISDSLGAIASHAFPIAPVIHD